MTAGLADTSVFIATEGNRPIRIERLPDALAVSVITIGELRAGVLAATDLDVRDRRLATLTRALEMDPVPIDQAVAEAWASLRVSLRDLGLRMPVNDSWIAATAIALGIPLVTHDEDYLHAPGLEVIHI
jgi:predicted nucleic acid-binding protein